MRNDLINEFKQELETRGRMSCTIKTYIRDLETFTDWLKGTYDEEFQGQISYLDVEKFKNHLIYNEKLKSSIINRKLKAINRFNTFLTSKGLTKEIHIDLIKEKHSSTRIKILTNDDFDKLKSAFYSAENKRDIAICEILYSTAMRPGEVIALELDDVNLLHGNNENNHAYIVVKHRKTDIIRNFRLNSDAKKAIQEYLSVRPKSISKKLFIGQHEGMTTKTLNKILSKYCKLANIERISTYAIRHTVINNMLNAVYSINDFSQNSVIYSSPDTTNKYIAIEDIQLAFSKLKLPIN